MFYRLMIQTWSKVGFSVQNQKLDEVTFEHQNQYQKSDGHFWTSKSKSKVGFSLLNIKIKINSWMVTIEDQNQKQ